MNNSLFITHGRNADTQNLSGMKRCAMIWRVQKNIENSRLISKIKSYLENQFFYLGFAFCKLNNLKNSNATDKPRTYMESDILGLTILQFL